MSGRYVDPTKIAPYGDEHATAVAGIIGAARNGDQVVGIAYNAKITPVDIFDGDDATYGWKALWNQNKFDVTNNSWGFTGSFVANPLDADDRHWYLSGFTTGANKGRGGLGTIETVAAGNYRQYDLSTETDLSPLFHPGRRRILCSIELCWLGGATGSGAEPSTCRGARSSCLSGMLRLA